ncbi:MULTISPECIES: DUF4282 domain-containing protein [Thermodesulfovibrio]|jgi:uncharacterized membrane protein|uniref:DUF4282 domain-containing protein n=1 Tax=Thermodesulfovibrio yellowstonii (strain ATCC 51303 / DSM 11347 / YP87) TaxID=289376 RepID=B5YI59_THEYD|nr:MULTISPECIES: DUF4282 domain-containing protein [Thermodesulfovibrio]ACI22184.1 conserved hypothetical protein [Thermodesulfovibrio yellowstonii DSM 11347]MDI6865850.1 DUF4282 domain-containing protein [Thermodesulfovibrio yellowstonii]
METEKGFFAQLFDLSFKSFITVKIIKLLYILAIIGSGLIGLMLLIGGVSTMKYSPGAGFLQIVLAPLIALLGIIWSRVFLELTVVLFKIEENTAKISEIKEKETKIGD